MPSVCRQYRVMTYEGMGYVGIKHRVGMLVRVNRWCQTDVGKGQSANVKDICLSYFTEFDNLTLKSK